VNWEAIAAVAEILGSLAVVASLGYVASQIRQSARESQRNVYRSVKTEIQDFRAMIAQDAQVTRIYREGLKQSTELNEDDRWRFGALMQHQFSTSEDVFRLRDVAMFQDLTDNMKWTLSRPGAKAWWSKGRYLYHPDYQTYVDNLLAELESAEPHDTGPNDD